jgi:hypothetical protein
MIGAARTGLLVLVLSAATVSPSIAGPPYVTDDPEPTETGHWENYDARDSEERPESAQPHHRRV